MPAYSIPYGKDTLTYDTFGAELLFYALPVVNSEPGDPASLIEAALDAPFGSGRIEDTYTKGQKAVIIVDDITRPTPQHLLIPAITRRLKLAGAKDKDISIVVALGTHRPMTDTELISHLGQECFESTEILQTDYTKKDTYTDLGRSVLGTPIKVFSKVVEADYRIASGNIVPHIAAGWGGGAKIMQPGVCSEETTEVTHLMACTMQPVLEICGTTDNVCRREIEEITSRIGLEFIVNTVLDEHRCIQGVFSGHYIHAHREGVKLAEKIMCPEIPATADIVIASANPCSADYWQGCKPYIFAQYGVRKGGVMIFLLYANEGLCGDAPCHDSVMRDYLLSDFDDILRDLDKGLIRDIVGINVPLFHAGIRKRITTICISEGLTKEEKRKMGFLHAADIYEAVRMAKQITGENASVGIIPYAGETLVRVAEENK